MLTTVWCELMADPKLFKGRLVVSRDHKIIGIVNRDKDHIPPITTTDANPFPYQVVVNPKAAPDQTWGPRMGIF